MFSSSCRCFAAPDRFAYWMPRSLAAGLACLMAFEDHDLRVHARDVSSLLLFRLSQFRDA
jgi:hypothetical protein